MEDLSKIFLK